MYNLKVAQMNVQCSPIQDRILYKFKLGYNATKSTKTVCEEGEDTVDHSSVTR